MIFLGVRRFPTYPSLSLVVRVFDLCLDLLRKLELNWGWDD